MLFFQTHNSCSFQRLDCDPSILHSQKWKGINAFLHINTYLCQKPFRVENKSRYADCMHTFFSIFFSFLNQYVETWTKYGLHIFLHLHWRWKKKTSFASAQNCEFWGYQYSKKNKTFTYFVNKYLPQRADWWHRSGIHTGKGFRYRRWWWRTGGPGSYDLHCPEEGEWVVGETVH